MRSFLRRLFDKDIPYCVLHRCVAENGKCPQDDGKLDEPACEYLLIPVPRRGMHLLDR